VDVILVAINFADRHTCNFETLVLPVAGKQNTGVVAMKVFGARDDKTGSWGTRKAKPKVDEENVELAIRYALGISGVATVNLGVHTAEQFRQNVQFVTRYRALTISETGELLDRGKALAAQGEPYLGPVKWGGSASLRVRAGSRQCRLMSSSPLAGGFSLAS
jgi:predicted aldo/keto reductase-like oxidoreductase